MLSGLNKYTPGVTWNVPIEEHSKAVLYFNNIMVIMKDTICYCPICSLNAKHCVSAVVGINK